MTDFKQTILDAADFLDEVAVDARHQDERWSVDVTGPLADIGWLGPTHDVLTATWQQALMLTITSPVFMRLLVNWLRTEAYCLAGDEDHTPCDPTECTALAALMLAQNILKAKVKTT